jgi:lactoylglutathione lyase
MQFAREGFDLGLFSNQRDAQLAFWKEEVGLTYDHMGKLGGGMQQHRHHLGSAILKMNHARDLLEGVASGGYRRLRVAMPGLDQPRRLQDPDGNAVEQVPSAQALDWDYGLVMLVSDVARHARFLSDALGLERVEADTFACGRARLWLEQAAATVRSADDWRGPGYRYITFQIRDARAALPAALAAGALPGEPLRDMGDLVRFGFIRDPDGNWIELSERTTFTGVPLGGSVQTA